MRQKCYLLFTGTISHFYDYENNFIAKGENNLKEILKVSIAKVNPNSEISFPKYATEQSAGMDLEADIPNSIVIKSKEIAIVPTGLKIALPDGYEAQVRPRSGLAAKNGVTVLNTPGTIDADYRGEIKVILINHSDKDFTIEPKMRIAQMVIAKYARTEWNVVADLEETERGTGGFGSTGTKALG